MKQNNTTERYGLILVISREIFRSYYEHKRFENKGGLIMSKKIRPDFILAIGSIALAGAQYFLSSVKEDKRYAQVKNEVLEELRAERQQNNNQQ